MCVRVPKNEHSMRLLHLENGQQKKKHDSTSKGSHASSGNKVEN